jgi:hypothetical protein
MSKRRLAVVAVALLSGGFLAAGPVSGQAPASDASRLQAVDACGAITSKSKRLACYDAAARGAAPAAATSGTAAPAITPQQAFGIETVREDKRPANRPRPLDEIEARVVSASDNGIGHWLIALEDGARWRMAEAPAHFSPPRPGDTIRIRRASLGSFLMYVGHQSSVRVIRVE